MSDLLETSVWSTVYRTIDPVIIQIIISKFADKGIRSYAARQSIVEYMPGVVGSIGELEIKVPEIDLDKAIATLLDLGYVPLEKGEETSETQ